MCLSEHLLYNLCNPTTVVVCVKNLRGGLANLVWYGPLVPDSLQLIGQLIYRVVCFTALLLQLLKEIFVYLPESVIGDDEDQYSRTLNIICFAF